MYSLTTLLISALAVTAAPTLDRRATLCTVVGSTTLPAEVQTAADALANSVTCDTSTTTIGSVPDAISGAVKFSDIDFSKSKSTALQFALDTFATPDDLASADLQTFQDQLDVYVATEAGLRSTDGSLAIKVPKFFLSFQVSRIQTAQGNPPKAAGSQVDHLLQKVLKNSPKESQALKDQVTALSKKLS